MNELVSKRENSSTYCHQHTNVVEFGRSIDESHRYFIDRSSQRKSWNSHGTEMRFLL